MMTRTVVWGGVVCALLLPGAHSSPVQPSRTGSGGAAAAAAATAAAAADSDAPGPHDSLPLPPPPAL
eukprot:scaffold10199_cov52-Phaeocystis_antarctica.AAC.3